MSTVMRISKYLLGFLFLILVYLVTIQLWALFGYWVIRSDLPPSREKGNFEWPDPASYHSAPETPYFEKLWSVQSMLISGTELSNHLCVSNDTVVIGGSLSYAEDPSLIGLDLATGGKVWQQSTAAPFNLTCDQHHVYLGEGAKGKIAAYEAATGDNVWETTVFWTKNAFYMDNNDSNLFVNLNPENFVVLDKRNGAVRNRWKVLGGEPSFYIEDNIGYYSSPAYMEARQVSSGSLVWRTRIRGNLRQAPVFTGNRIYVRSILGDLFALDKLTGHIIWETDYPREQSVAGSFAVADRFLYHLTLDSNLYVLDAETGEFVTAMEMIPSLLSLEPRTLSSSSFYVVVANDILLIYFGDSHQLFAYRFIPPDSN